MPYIGKAPSSGIRSRFIYTATAGQTTFTGADDNNKTLGYTDSEYVDVYLNGVLLEPADYTATSKTSVVLDSGATVGDTMEIVVYDTFSVFNGTFSGDVSVGGDLTVDTNTLVVDSTNNRVGVGTSPAQSFHVNGSAVQFTNTQNSYLQINTTDTHLYTAGAHPLRFGTNSTERLRILSGGGLTFNGDTAAANALDDYEEGAWTATLSHISGSDPNSAVTATGHYTKIGDLVHIRIQMNNFNSTGASGAISITGLPYSGDISTTASGDVMFNNCADHADNVVNVAVYVNNATLQFYQSIQDGAWSLVQHNAGSGRYLYFSATYKTTG